VIAPCVLSRELKVLTPLGKSFVPVISSIRKWRARHLAAAA
jgi:DNA-binding HxlR family transcriptional regulator